MSAYGRIQAIGVHQAFPGGPKKCFLDVDWFTNEGVSPLTGNPLVDTAQVYETSSVFIENIYQIPVALWPYDPLTIATRLQRKAATVFEVIDRNQDQEA